jgi:hypothetical protein
MNQPLPRGGPGTPNDQKYIGKSFYVYEVVSTSLAASTGTTTLTFQIDRSQDFFWTKFNAHAVSASDGTTVSNELLPELTIAITNTQNSRTYSNVPMSLASMSGNGRLPFILPMMTLWESTATIKVDLANVSDNTTYSSVRLAFIGIRCFLG